MNFRKINNITGWVIFAISAMTYILTVEPTASFWDCGEFIAASFKLQVPHPPGAPLFLLLGRIFSMLAGNDTTKVAYWINISSALASAFTSLFLFWSITLLGRRIMKTTTQALTTPQAILLMGAGVIGSLAYTFCDSAWWSAVESEVYAMSSFFTAIVVWAMLKWELIEDESASNRWLIFIAYMVGLSIGIHLLNLVTLPALAFIFYFKKYKYTLLGAALTFLSGFAIILVIMSGIIPGLPSVAGSIEIFFVNSLGMPFGTGISLFIVFFLGALIFGVYYSQKVKNPLINTILLSTTFILIGYASYTMVLIRSNYNPPINENDPSDIIKYVSYLKREQYGDRPLLFGPSFITPLERYDEGAPLYRKGKEKYEIYDHRVTPVYDSRQEMLLPRMFSKVEGHPQMYRDRLGLKPNQKPSFFDNIYYMFRYQFGNMYLRYFMWNFAGRESDIEQAGWLKPWEVSTKNLPIELATNKGRNQFFWLPLFLGLFGLFFQIGKDRRGFLVTLLLFFLTGLALVIYLNSPPVEPRERDYIYVGSYYAFAIWIGLGVMGMGELLSRLFKNETIQAAVATAVCLFVPIIMVAQGWDDHDRSKRYHSVDSAKNLLNSCAPNAILFTGGDNDTFPLWYVQEVEGFRTDVRVCNLSLLGTDWYVEQMKRKVYKSEPLPIKLPFERFIQGTNDQIAYVENPNVKNGMNLVEYLKLVKNNDPNIQYPLQNGETITILPTNILVLPIDSAALANSDLIQDKLKQNLRSTMVWELPKNDIFKPELMMLEMIANNAQDGWKRPIYFSSTLGQSNYMNLDEYFQVEGLAYRLTPVKVPGSQMGYVNSDIMYDNMMNKMYWREMNNPKVYYDENYRKFPINSRLNFYRLAQQLYDEGKNDKAKAVIKHCLEVLPDNVFPYDRYTVNFIPLLYNLGETKQAIDMSELMVGRAEKSLEYYINKKPFSMDVEIQDGIQIIYRSSNFFKERDKKLGEKYEKLFAKYYDKLVKMGALQQ